MPCDCQFKGGEKGSTVPYVDADKTQAQRLGGGGGGSGTWDGGAGEGRWDRQAGTTSDKHATKPHAPRILLKNEHPAHCSLACPLVVAGGASVTHLLYAPSADEQAVFMHWLIKRAIQVLMHLSSSWHVLPVLGKG